MISISERKFQSALDMAVAGLPGELKTCLKEIDIIVSKIAEKSDLLGTNLEEELDLLSLHEAVPISNAYHNDMNLRGQLTIFKMALEKICEEESDLAHQLTIILEEELSYHATP
ncbi:MAG: putative Zn-dependent protease, minimal metalloprotease (MMP)-like domain [Chloroflexi bacterium]|jgi:predicted Zn-dependent protease with MMP-like domain|nr:MAG: putative Zn-dependent protease, minimal metalloprotease (MMP)-like domain [Chloroflexota bacterium]